MADPIAKSDLVHGAYYGGVCRNATVARWNANTQRFIHWRTKFGNRFTETIPCFGEENWPYDWFRAHEMIREPKLPEDRLPLED